MFPLPHRGCPMQRQLGIKRTSLCKLFSLLEGKRKEVHICIILAAHESSYFLPWVSGRPVPRDTGETRKQFAQEAAFTLFHILPRLHKSFHVYARISGSNRLPHSFFIRRPFVNCSQFKYWQFLVPKLSQRREIQFRWNLKHAIMICPNF